MDAFIKKRCTQIVTVYPFLRVERGDRLFGKPYEVRAYITYKERIVPTAEGSDWRITTVLILDANAVENIDLSDIKNKIEYGKQSPFILDKHTLDYRLGYEGNFHLDNNTLNGRYVLSSGKEIQFTTINSEDEVELTRGSRVQVQSVRVYQGLKKGIQNLEVIL